MNDGRRLLIAVVVLFLGTVFVLSAAAVDPIKITTEEELAWITNSTDNLSGSYILTNDITISNADWAGIGNSTALFTGTTIHGFFNTTGGDATINNTVVNVITKISGTDNNVGALAHCVFNTTAIDNCSVVLNASGNVTGASNVGGLVGNVEGGTRRTRSSSPTARLLAGRSLAVASTNRFGGLVGNSHNATMENCFAATDVSGASTIVGGPDR